MKNKCSIRLDAIEGEGATVEWEGNIISMIGAVIILIRDIANKSGMPLEILLNTINYVVKTQTKEWD